MRSSCQLQEEFGVTEKRRSGGCPDLLLLLLLIPAHFDDAAFKNKDSALSLFLHLCHSLPFHLFPHAWFIIHHAHESSICWINKGCGSPSLLCVCYSPLHCQRKCGCFSRILPWRTVLTATTARSPCTAASTSNRTTALTASHATTACSQTLVMSVKSWSAMTQGWEAFWHDQTGSQRSWNIIKCVPVEHKRVFSARQSFIWPVNVCCNDI